ncbi:oligosaccharide flippase family protein [Dietzia sp. PP-33]|uniref:oligosaccharide flippase family protein n=1 Tax=Dietzia sp. PP-33 TaxID=2957500 RepID=UPI0029A34663|nr:oligosaccharide flippase family protein [Dietzia sp. PP-33]MDX2358775.1 oligosaccharide flippase family protein [Dietzia sp. PP-33]
MSSTQSRIIRTTAYLTIGTFVAQGLGTASQFLLAAWLTPSDFGLFATANASLFILFALVNLGDVTGYLSNQGWSERLLLKSTLKLNLLLSFLALLVASVYLIQDRIILGWIVALLAVQVPLMGRTLALYAIAVRHGRVRLIVLSQMAAASLKLLIGILVAATWQSPVALALALIAYSITMAIPLEVFLRRNMPREASDETPLRKARFKWAAHSLSQAFPTQIDYAVVAVVSSPYVLGLYYFAYQATAGISALLTGPLMKSSLAEFGQLEADERSVAMSLLRKVTGAVAFTVVCLALLVYVGQPLFPDSWVEAPVVIVLLLGSLPSRFVAPVAESRQVADDRWWRSASVNLIDTVGTAATALVALTDSVLALAGAIAIWKLIIAVIRIALCFPEAGPVEIGRAIMWPLLSLMTCSIAALTWSTGHSWQILSLAATLGAVIVTRALLVSRRRALR